MTETPAVDVNSIPASGYAGWVEYKGLAGYTNNPYSISGLGEPQKQASVQFQFSNKMLILLSFSPDTCSSFI